MSGTGAKHYDFILAGGGAAGLSLAYHLTRGPFRDARLLIVDEQVKRHNDHTWCSWLREGALFDPIAYRSWERLAFRAPGLEREFALAPYRYRMLRAADFYRFTRAALTALPGVDFLTGTVTHVSDGPERAEIYVNELSFTADWVFDSRYRAADYHPLDRRHHYLYQHFLGWEIETVTPVFDPACPTFFDFRTPQRGAMRFVYVLPFTARRALVEYTLFSGHLLPRAEYEAALQAYIGEVLGVGRYHLLEEEYDLIPMTDRPFPRRAGRRVLNVGTRGGRVKASTGFAFHRIQQDAAAIVRSLEREGHPFALPGSSRLFRFTDSVLLQLLERRGDLGAPVFTALFRNNPIDRIFRFLDEESSLMEVLQVMASLPPWPFLRAAFRNALRKSHTL